jgi:demethylmenaquinone methyltransferase/2-methoxy-6-polyprenyl-1,4-benzoquinol methylase
MPKPDLREHISSIEKKQEYANRLFETIATRYDFITGFLSYGMDRAWKRKLIDMAELAGDELVLDIACGTGDITFALARRLPAGAAVGLDITGGMLRIAQSKKRDGRIANVFFHRGDIMRMPFPPATFDRVTGGYALRNTPDIKAALAEILRVLKPGGRFYSLDFAHPPNRTYRWLYQKYLVAVGSGLGLVLHGDPDTYRYIAETLRLYPGQRVVARLMEEVGFSETGIHEFGGGITAINYGTKLRQDHD